MKSLFAVGLTGGIGSGKTYVANIFESLGASLVDTDVIARELTVPKGLAIDAIAKSFGEDFILEDGSLNRAKMRDLVFAQPSKRLQLEAIMHPLICQVALQQAKDATGDYVIYVNPLLLDQDIWEPMRKRILVVDCSEEEQIARVKKRSQLSKETILSIMAAQLPRQKRLSLAHDVIVNDGDNEKLIEQIKKLHLIYKAF